MRQAAHVVATEEDCRKAVQDLAARKVPMVKIWVQDRTAGIPKMSPELYKATIDEAHRHNDEGRRARDLSPRRQGRSSRAGIDGFAHLPTDVDDELMTLLKESAERLLHADARNSHAG